MATSPKRKMQKWSKVNFLWILCCVVTETFLLLVFDIVVFDIVVHIIGFDVIVFNIMFDIIMFGIRVRSSTYCYHHYSNKALVLENMFCQPSFLENYISFLFQNHPT